VQVQLLVWIFAMRIMMVVVSGISYLINETIAKGKYGNAAKMDFEHPLTFLVWLTSIISVVMTYGVSYLLIGSLSGDDSMWWKLSTIITCGTLAGAIIPEMIKVFTSTRSGHGIMGAMLGGKQACRRILRDLSAGGEAKSAMEKG